METPDGSLAEELLRLAETDQAMRAKAIRDEAAWDPAVDKASQERLTAIVAERGWPTIQMVGAEASQAAWLLVQHAPSLAFMEHCLELMKQLPLDSINPANRAYLEDRVLMLNGKSQIYGTQFRGMELYPVEDIVHVDERRASVGLGTLIENEARIRKLYTTG